MGSEAEFGTMPLASENNVLKNRQRSFDWNDARVIVGTIIISRVLCIPY